MPNHVRNSETTPIFDSLALQYAVDHDIAIFIPVNFRIDWGDYWMPTLGKRPTSLPNI